MLALALTMSTVVLVAGPAHFPDARQAARPERPAHRADIDLTRRPPPAVPVHHDDPFADMLLG
jgi:hypothetical protein